MPIWKPHDYQLTAKSFLLANPYSGLFLDPGLGKTSTTLSTVKTLLSAGNIKGILLIAPLRVTYSVWPGEIEKWINFNKITNTILHGKKGKETLYGPQKNIYLMNPEGLPWLLEELHNMVEKGEQPPFDTLWIDESTKFKSPTAKTRFKILEVMLPLFKRRHIMTGTPAPRGLMDLWSQIFLIDGGEALGSNFYKFRNKYFYRTEYDEYTWIPKEGSEEKIHELIAPLVLQMSAEDYLDMPDLIYNNINVELPAKAMKLYKQMEQDFFIQLDDKEASADQTAQASMKCHQMSNGNVYESPPEDLTEEELKTFKKNRKVIHIHKSKVEALKDLVEELNGKPLLIAYQYKHDLDALRGLFGVDVAHIGSGVTPKAAKAVEAAWNAGEVPVLLGHPASMGHGLNLQEKGNDVCWFSLTWNLEEYDQFIRRVYRQGVSGNKVRVHHIVSNNTLDEAMLSRLGDKAETQEDLRKALKRYRDKTISG